MNNLLAYLSRAPWAILDNHLLDMVNIFQSILAEPITGKYLLEAADKKRKEINGGALDKEKREYDGYGYEIQDGIAVIEIDGIITKNWSFWNHIDGLVSTSLIGNDLKHAMENPKVEAILFDIDSPGGTVDGTKDLADTIFDLRGQKPMVALAQAMMASAAYYIGSAADYIIAKPDSMVGSIGVYTTHFDWSGFYKDKLKVNPTIIKAGKYKAIGTPYQPLSKEDKAYWQSEIDYYYSLFVNDIARNRGVSVETAQDKMADARVFIGQQAKDAGLVDDIQQANKITLPKILTI